MVSSGPGAGEMLEVEGDGAAPRTIKNLCLSGLSGSLWAAWEVVINQHTLALVRAKMV